MEKGEKSGEEVTNEATFHLLLVSSVVGPNVLLRKSHQA